MRRSAFVAVALLGLVVAGCGDDGGSLEDLVASEVGDPVDGSSGTGSAPAATAGDTPATTLADTPATSSTLAEADDTSVFSLELGQCFNDEVAPGEIQEVPIVPCAQPHDNEVYAVFDMAGDGAYPGDAVVQQAATDGCLAAFEPFVGLDYQSSVLDASFLSPTAEGWVELGDREIVCYVFRLDRERVTGSLRGTAQ
jgi:hypothetical protein